MYTAQPPVGIRTWQDAELNAAAWVRYWGYPDAAARPGGADGGLDVRASGAVAQVKFQTTPVGRPAVQRLVGANMGQPRQMFFLSYSPFAAPAVTYANQMGVALFQYDRWGQMAPANLVAQHVAARAAQLAGAASSAGAPVRSPSLQLPPAVVAHLTRYWALWVAGVLGVVPLVALVSFAGYPWWATTLAAAGTFLACWSAAAVFLGAHWTVHGAPARGVRAQWCARAEPHLPARVRHAALGVVRRTDETVCRALTRAAR